VDAFVTITAFEVAAMLDETAHLTEQEGKFAAMARLVPMLIEEALRFPPAPTQALFETGQRGAQARSLGRIVRGRFAVSSLR
jgi:hypothetical protein